MVFLSPLGVRTGQMTRLPLTFRFAFLTKKAVDDFIHCPGLAARE
jgi:hypothetical protein